MNTAILRPTITTPGADTNVYVLFATVAVTGTGSSWPDPGWAKGHIGVHGLKKLVVDIEHTQAFDLNFYKSNNRGTSWNQVSTETAIAASATATTKREYLVEHLDDCKLELVNGGSAQATFVVNVALSPERAAP